VQEGQRRNCGLLGHAQLAGDNGLLGHAQLAGDNAVDCSSKLV
jgi:hypothetical protein